MKKTSLFIFSAFAVFALASCSTYSYTHTHSIDMHQYMADLNHDGKIAPFQLEGDPTLYQEENLTWAESYDVLIKESNSIYELSKIANNMDIAPDEPERTNLARYEVLHEAEELLMSTSAIFPIYNYRDPYLLKPGLKGVYWCDLGTKFFDKLENSNGSKEFRLCLGTKADTYDPAENSDATTSNISANILIGPMRWVKAEEAEDSPNTFRAELEVSPFMERAHKYILLPHGDERIDHDVYWDIDETELKNLPEAEKEQFYNTARWDFKIKPNMKWSSGNEMIADDFLWAWRRVASKTFGMWSAMLDCVRGYEDWYNLEKEEVGTYDDPNHIFSGLIDDENDKYHFTIQLVNDCAYFESLMAFPSLVPLDRKKIEEATSLGKVWWQDPAYFSSNGPFKMSVIDNKESGHVDVVRNDEYHNYDPQDEDTNVLPDKISFVILDDDTATWAGYNSGSLQLIDSIATGMIDQIKADIPNEWKMAVQIGIYYMLFNVNDNALDFKPDQSETDREYLRAGLNLLINRQDICDSINKSGATPANGFVSEGIVERCVPEDSKRPDGYWYAKRDADDNLISADWHERNLNMADIMYETKDLSSYWLGNRKPGGFATIPTEGVTEEEAMKQCIDTAIKFIEKAGIEYKNDKFVNFPEITITTNTGTGHEAICERMQAYYKLFGINLEIETQEWNAFLNSRRAGDFAIARNGWIADYPDARTYLDICTSDNGNNDTQLGRDSWHRSR